MATMKFKPHYLKANKASHVPQRHLFVDVETNLLPQEDRTTNQTLKLGWACYWRQRPDKAKDTLAYTFFRGEDEFWDLVESHCLSKSTLLLVMHNVGFDFGVLHGFAQLAARGWVLKRPYTNGMTTILGFNKGKYRIKVLDNGNYFPGKLANLGVAVGYPKLNIDFETCSWEELKTYCKRDTKIMLKAWQMLYAFIPEHRIGVWRATLPSLAWNAFRHSFMSHKILVHANPELYELERMAYKGGRCSVFWVGHRKGEHLYKMDVNSMYPSVMVDNVFPTEYVRDYYHVGNRTMQRLLSKYCCVARVVVDTDEPVYPIRNKTRNVYPVGRFETYLTTPELKYAVEHKHLRRVHRVAVYKKERIFHDYVTFFYPLKVAYKKEDNRPFYHVVKLFLNGLYGRFGMKAHKWEKITEVDPRLADIDFEYNDETKERINYYRWGDDVWKESGDGESENSCPAIAAHVTAHARLYLWQIINQAGRENVLYADTDGIICTEAGYGKLADLLDDFELGKLKVEGESWDTLIRAPKYYFFGGKWKRKGVPAKAVEIEPNVFEFDRFPSLKGQGKWEKDTPFHTTKVVKRFSLKIYDGVPQADHWVKPLDSEHLEVKNPFDPEKDMEFSLAEWQVQALREARIVPHEMVFKLWNYRKGTWKRQKDRQGNLVPIEYSVADTWASELGFDDLNTLQKGVLQQLSQDREIREIWSNLS